MYSKIFQVTSKDNQEGEKCEGKWESKSFVWHDDGDVDDSWLVVVHGKS